MKIFPLIVYTALISYMTTVSSCAPMIAIKSTTFEGQNNKVLKSFEYNLKSKTIIEQSNNTLSKKKFSIKNKDVKNYLNKFKDIGIYKNFCWISKESSQQYGRKYEIILSQKKENLSCIDNQINGEIYNLFYELKNFIDKDIQTTDTN